MQFGIRPVLIVVGVAVALAGLGGCDEFKLQTKVRSDEAAREALAAGDFPRAVRNFEAALDGTPGTADIHYELGLLFDDKLKEPVSALHHYRRFLRMSEDVPRKREVQEFVSRIELVLATRTADSGILTKREGARLKNENLELRQQLTDIRAELAAEKKKPKATPTPGAKAGTTSERINPATVEAESRVGKETRTYTVQTGDTLASISRKFYNTPQRWKDIADANHNLLQGTVNLQVGQVLIIP